MEVMMQLGLLAVGFVLLVKGADWFVEGASKVAEKFGIPQLVIGLTIVAMGTSLPEAAVSVSAALKGSAEITIGNIVGSNILNVLLILGLTAVVRPVAVQKSTVRYEIPFVILVSALLMGIGYTDQVVGRVDGILLWALMICYLIYLLVMSKKGVPLPEEDMPEKDKPMPVWKMLMLIVLGGVMIVAGSKADIAVGNIVGSNIFNILFVVGTSALITPVAYAQTFLVDSIVCIAAVILLWLCVCKNKRLGRVGGFIMLLGYGGYFIYLMH